MLKDIYFFDINIQLLFFNNQIKKQKLIHYIQINNLDCLKVIKKIKTLRQKRISSIIRMVRI